METKFETNKAAIVQAAFLVAIPAGAKVRIKHQAIGTYPTIELMMQKLIEEALKDAGITAQPEIIVEVLAKGPKDPRWSSSRNGKSLQQAYDRQIANATRPRTLSPASEPGDEELW